MTSECYVNDGAHYSAHNRHLLSLVVVQETLFAISSCHLNTNINHHVSKRLLLTWHPLQSSRLGSNVFIVKPSSISTQGTSGISIIK